MPCSTQRFLYIFSYFAETKEALLRVKEVLESQVENA